MSDYRFGSGDYGLSIYPTEAFDGIGGFDIDLVERVEIEGVDFVRERTCKIIEWYEARGRHEIGNNRVRFSCGDFGTCHDKFCPECGARVVGE